MTNMWTLCGPCVARNNCTNIFRFLFNGRVLHSGVLGACTVSTVKRGKKFTVFAEERLADFNILVGNEFDSVNNTPSGFWGICAHVEGHLGSGETRSIPCGTPMTGRYVLLELQDTQFLTICEFEVYDTPVAMGMFLFIKIMPS